MDRARDWVSVARNKGSVAVYALTRMLRLGHPIPVRITGTQTGWEAGTPASPIPATRARVLQITVCFRKRMPSFGLALAPSCARPDRDPCVSLS